MRLSCQINNIFALKFKFLITQQLLAGLDLVCNFNFQNAHWEKVQPGNVVMLYCTC